MTSVTALPFSRPLTRADLVDVPDDGHRYELLDGVLLVSPGPRWPHQDVLGNLYVLLKLACPAGLAVGLAPFAVAFADDTELQPDMFVARRTDITEHDLPVAPLLCVEVLSPSTRRFDLLLKRDRYQEAGVPSYWLVDPDEPAITVLDLHDGVYEQVAVVRAGEEHRVALPFMVRLAPSELVG